MHAIRLLDAPIVTPQMSVSLGRNVNGPSLIRVPEQVRDPLGCYYLYFAHHSGDRIRLACADALTGPWRVYEPGVLDLAASGFRTEPIVAREITNRTWLELMEKWGDEVLELLRPHVASPDVHACPDGEICMYFHGLLGSGDQLTRLARSRDGLHFEVLPQLLGPPYFRVFRHGGAHYALATGGKLCRSPDGVAPFEEGPDILGSNARHCAVRLRGKVLDVFWSRFGDEPEHLLHATVELTGDWRGWKAAAPGDLLFPERDWEGADLPVVASRAGGLYERAHQLRDPGIYEEDGRSYLLYSVAAEQGIGLAELAPTE